MLHKKQKRLGRGERPSLTGALASIDTGIVDSPAEDRLPSEGWANSWWDRQGGGQPVAGRDRNRPAVIRTTTILGPDVTRVTGGTSRTGGKRVLAGRVAENRQSLTAVGSLTTADL
jgi:hypothetical protein